MGRYLGPRAKRSRAVGMDLDPFSSALRLKCKHDRRPGKPLKRNDRSSDHGKQLEMKQAVRDCYGLREGQFKRFVAHAERMSGSAPDNLLVLLESRLDNLVYRMGFAATRREARQLISHRKIKLAGRIHQSPSTIVKQGEIVEVIEKFHGEERIVNALKKAKESDSVKQKGSISYDWIDTDFDGFKGSMIAKPDPQMFGEMFKVSLIIEFYSKS